ncbi:hypothetical protein J2T20_004461 [Paenibacillus wynnii]|nr:hypothetical protein [Paenibacillus wynnii]
MNRVTKRNTGTLEAQAFAFVLGTTAIESPVFIAVAVIHGSINLLYSRQAAFEISHFWK